MPRITRFCCEICGTEIKPGKGFHLSGGSLIESVSIKPGEYCIACLAKMAGESLITQYEKEQIRMIEDDRARRIDQERRDAKDW